MRKLFVTVTVTALVLIGFSTTPAAARPPCGFECFIALGCAGANPNQGCGGSGSDCLEYICGGMAVATSQWSDLTPDEFSNLVQEEMARIKATLGEDSTWEQRVAAYGASEIPFRITNETDEFANAAYEEHREEIKRRESAGEAFACAEPPVASAASAASGK